MVDTGDGGIQILALHAVDSLFGFQHGAEQLLGAENLMAAAKGPDLRKDLVEGAHAKGHGVSIVDNPGFRSVIPDGFADGDKHGDGTHGAHESAGADRVAHRLPDAEALRQVDV